MLPLDESVVAAVRAGQAFRDVAQFGFHRHDGGEHEQHLVEQGTVPIRTGVLLKIAEPGRFRPDDTAGVGGKRTGQDTEQGGLAAAVGPDQADLVPVPDIKGHTVEQTLFPEVFADVLYR